MVFLSARELRTSTNYNRPRQFVFAGFLSINVYRHDTHMMTKKYPFWLIAGALFFLFSFFTTIVSLVIDWWWFSEVGFTEIFFTSLIAKVTLGFAVFFLAFLFLYGNLRFVVKDDSDWHMNIPEGLFGRPVRIDGMALRKLAVIISVIIAVLFGYTASSGWQYVLKYLSATPFGTSDAIFGKDIAFYIFSLPLITFFLAIIKTVFLVTLVLCGGIYFFRGSLRFSFLTDAFQKFNLQERLERSRTEAHIIDAEGNVYEPLESRYTPEQRAVSQVSSVDEARARLHTAILLALFFATLVVNAYLSMFQLLTGKSGQVYGAVFTDVSVRIPLLWVSIAVMSIAVVAVLYWGKSGKHRFLFGAVTVYLFVGLSSGIIPVVFQKLIVAPNELVKETPFIEHNIAATREAYGIDHVEEREISGDKPLTSDDIAKNNLTVKNIRLWDRAPLLSTFSQIQEIRTYYEFASVDNDRYTIDGEIRQIMLSPRELSSESLPNRNWINERLTFTHGYGLAAGPVNQVTAEGLPVLFVKDLPPQSDVKELEVTRPEIYYGELSNDYVFVNTKSKEFDYPKGEENVYSTYEGGGGVKMSSFTKRLLYAMHFRSLKVLLSNDITNDSKVLYYRNIKERVSKVAPFLTFDRDPYSVIADGKMYWIADAYTVSDAYPYSQPSSLNGSQVNYIRNSVKVVVDAYNGSITLYLADTEDPIIQTYKKIFPTTFRSMDEMPKNLVDHLRYPEDIFKLQTEMYSTYHMDDPQIFYNKEDQWEIPAVAVEGEQSSMGAVPVMTPRHMIMKLPAEKEEEYVLMLPFTPRAKDNLSAWMVARNDGDQYGKLLVYRFPKQKLIFGPKQVIGRINQDAEVSRQISLWDQRGSQVIQGPLLVIPIEESLIYVRPLYLKADAGKIPELKRVIVAYENKIAMEETLEAGLAKIFGTASQVSTSTDPKKITIPTAVVPDAQRNRLLQQANEAYESALRAQREGNWALYGEEITKLGNTLKALQR
jgi:uncharacterized membrane protein (UPF0182 family)